MRVHFNFLNFLIFGWRNSLHNSWTGIISFLTEPLESNLSTTFYQKLYKSVKQVNVDIHHFSDF